MCTLATLETICCSETTLKQPSEIRDDYGIVLLQFRLLSLGICDRGYNSDCYLLVFKKTSVK